MNASLTHFPPKELKKPDGLQTVEICSKSGLLATDKCPQEDVYRELATKEQMPTDPCDVHGDARTRIAHDLPDAGVPRASLVVDTAQVHAIAVKGATLLAENDPYNAIKSTAKPPKPPQQSDAEIKAALPVETPAKAEAAQGEPALRAEPVAPNEQSPNEQLTEKAQRAEPVLRAQPVAPEKIPRAEPVATPPRAGN